MLTSPGRLLDIRGAYSDAMGTCRLCGISAQLLQSHLIPAEVYRHIRASTGKNRNPALISETCIITTSRQAKQALLCAGCENLFNNRGERWTLSQMRRQDRKFELKAYVQNVCNPIVRVGDTTLMNGPARIDQIAYFALSVFWRAAVASWKLSKTEAIGIDLGSYEQALAAYLKDEKALPPSIALGIRVVLNPISEQLVKLPSLQQRLGAIRCYDFQIPGIHFCMWIGSQLADGWLDFCAVRTGRVFTVPGIEADHLYAVAETLRRVKLRGRPGPAPNSAS